MSEHAILVQDQRDLRITTTLGDSAVILTDVQGSDLMSTPFLFQIQFVTTRPDSDILTLLGKSATISLCSNSENPRLLNGLFRKLSGPVPMVRGLNLWRAEVVPQLAFLAYTSDCRIFQSLTPVQIISQVLNLHGITKFEFRNLMGTYPTLDYCVQYRESGLNFISRLMEHYGIFYWFEHSDGSHLLVMADSKQAAKAVWPETLVMPDQNQNAPIKSLLADFSFRPGTWTLKDYDFTSPDSPLQSSTPTVISQVPMKNFEVYEYPGAYADASGGENLARIRIEQEESQYNKMRGEGTFAAFDPGYQVTIAVPDGNSGHTDTKLLLVEVYHHASDLTQVVMGAAPPSYSNEFTGVPTTYNYRPERVSVKPFVHGVQTAKVTGPAGQKIYTDKYGRVKVRFHWDRNPGNDADQNSSCWLRVSQIWASGVGGGIQVPRIGEEVIVDFLEGDPDRPIITGRVFNGINTVPYGLPGNQTQFGFKTQSIPSGGFNELRFEDKAGSEEVWIHAQKDFNRKVNNNETDNIGGNVVRNVTGNVTHTTSGNHSKTVSGTQTHNVTGNVSVTHAANTTHFTGAVHSMTVGAQLSEQGPAKLSTWQSVVANIASHTTTQSYSLTFTGLAFSLIGENLQVIPSGNTVGIQNMQAYAINQQFCAFNQQINAIDVSFNLLVNKTIALKYTTAATNLLNALNHCHVGASIVKTFGLEVNV